MAKPKLALVPSAQGDKFYSVLPSSGVGDFDFSRSGGATRINSQGLIETVADGVSRLNYPIIDGKVVGCPSHLLEPQRTNLIQYSEDFSNAYWNKSGSSVVSGFVSPSGDTSAFKLVESSTTSTHELEVIGIAVVADKYTISLFAKADERGKIRIQLRNYFAGDPSVIFDLENGTFEQNVQAIGSMTLLSNGFYKCTFTTVLNAIAGGNAILNVNLVDEANQTSYTGNGTSGLYIYGAQLEQGSYPTSYIPNYGTALGVTRSAETANNSGDASTFNSEGVLMAEISALSNDGTSRRIAISNGNNTNRIEIIYSSTDLLSYLVVSGNVAQATGNISNPSTTMVKAAIKYKINDFSFWVNGFEVLFDTNGVVPIGLSTLRFEQGDGGNDFYGLTKQIQYFDSALNDSDLEKLTSWVSFTDMAEGQLYSIE